MTSLYCICWDWSTIFQYPTKNKRKDGIFQSSSIYPLDFLHYVRSTQPQHFSFSNLVQTKDRHTRLFGFCAVAIPVAVSHRQHPKQCCRSSSVDGLTLEPLWFLFVLMDGDGDGLSDGSGFVSVSSRKSFWLVNEDDKKKKRKFIGAA